MKSMGGYGARRRWSEREDGVKKAAERIAPVIPAPVRSVCERLAAGGHAAYTVGGAVRDALLGRDIADWDVATSARPEEVLELRDPAPVSGHHRQPDVVRVEREHFAYARQISDRVAEDFAGRQLQQPLRRRDQPINRLELL